MSKVLMGRSALRLDLRDIGSRLVRDQCEFEIKRRLKNNSRYLKIR